VPSRWEWMLIVTFFKLIVTFFPFFIINHEFRFFSHGFGLFKQIRSIFHLFGKRLETYLTFFKNVLRNFFAIFSHGIFPLISDRN
jgi:hypothetical protein